MHSTRVEAFRSLCELIHLPTPKRLAAGRSQDWSHYPVVREALSGSGLTPELAGERMRVLLEDAIADLRDAYPGNGDRFSPLDVLESHLVAGHSWDAIVTERAERGHPVSERTLRSRQRDGLKAVLEWAEVSEPVVVEATASRPNTTWAAATVLVAAAIAIGFWFGQGGREEPHADHPIVGAHIPMPGGVTELPPPYPQWSLPQLGTPYNKATVVEPSPGRHLVVGATHPSGSHGGTLVVYDPDDERIVWMDRFRPTREMLHLGPDENLELQLESFRAEHLIYGNEPLNLDDRIVVVYVHRYMHCFAVEYDLLTGERKGIYHHPGRLDTHLLVDFDRDGVPILLLGGQDNLLDRPVLVALEPGHLHGDASTLSDDPTEDACARVLLPAVPQLQDAWGVDRLQVMDQTSHRWNPGLGLISFAVGAHERLPAYRVFLNSRLEPAAGTPLSVGDGPSLAWRGAGLDPTDLAPYVQQIGILGERRCLPPPPTP